MEDPEDTVGASVKENPRKKRRSRVSRACDECRSRKIRCDGGQPCENCDAFDRSCYYRSNRQQKIGSIQHVRALEDSLTRARRYIEELHEQVPKTSQKHVDAIFVSPSKLMSPSDPSHRSDSDMDDDDHSPRLENMMEQQAQLNSTDNKKTSFYGDSSGFAFLQKTKQIFDDTQGTGTDSDLSKSTQHAITQLFDSPLPDKQALHADVPVSQLLPSRESATDLLHVVFGQVYPLLQFLDEATFQERTNRIYGIEPMDFDDADHDFLPLLYAVLALGFLFSQRKHQKYGCVRAVTEGMRHFIAARGMLDVTNCRDLVSLQVLICFILFLMSTARIATSHTYTGLALTSAIRLGLHSQGRINDSFSQKERSERRRVFETIIKMDIYTSSVLGLPTLTDLAKLERTLLQDIDIDIERRSEPSEPSASSTIKKEDAIVASAKHLEVLLIIARVINTLYPEKASPRHSKGKKPTFTVRNADITELEAAFKDWRDNLPQSLQPKNRTVAFESYELEMVHNFGHIVLYRPFLHYLAKPKTTESDQRQLHCALACVKIARRTVLKSAAVQKSGYLSPASWSSVYTIFLSIVTMVFFLAAQTDANEATDLQQTAEVGIRILACSECQDIGARRCIDVLRVLIKRLSHIVDLDVDKIREETPSMCQSYTPTSHANVAKLDAISSESGRTEKAQPENPVPDWTDPDSSGIQARFNFSEMPWRQTTPHHYIDTNPLSAYLASNPNYPLFDTGSRSQPDSMHQPSSTSRSSANQYQQMPVSGAGPFQTMGSSHPTSQSDTMEIPYAENFAWPFQSSSANQQASDGGQSGQEFGWSSAQQQLTSEDIAAFMRINPAEHPFM